ncbi:hypothetical protein [Thermohalobaculum sediminis]|uniref:hypothetical protein n=1 Tax=Thermohalobaculum sediminis TaxID=2939436 RepID=UPI0020BEE0AB|nr:hypothetical protein [Limibaculum sediminis]
MNSTMDVTLQRAWETFPLRPSGGIKSAAPGKTLDYLSVRRQRTREARWRGQVKKLHVKT